MIIVKDKGAKSPIYVPRNINLQPSNTNNGEGGINEEELNKYLEGYVTDEELNDVLNNIDITNIVELTQAEYDVLVANGEINEEVIYLITDETINLKTINGESIIGDGDITIEIPDYSQDINDIKGQLGDIETILNNIIGNN